MSSASVYMPFLVAIISFFQHHPDQLSLAKTFLQPSINEPFMLVAALHTPLRFKYISKLPNARVRGENFPRREILKKRAGRESRAAKSRKKGGQKLGKSRGQAPADRFTHLFILGQPMSKQVEIFMSSQVKDEPTARAEYLKKLDRLRKGKSISVNSFAKRYGLEK